MSIFIRAFSPPKTSRAITRASSVLPTPVGPMKRKLPIGREGFAIPERPRRMAFETERTASSCPITDFLRWSSSFERSSSSEPWTFETGIPVFREIAVARFSSVKVGGVSLIPFFSNSFSFSSRRASAVFAFAAFSKSSFSAKASIFSSSVFFSIFIFLYSPPPFLSASTFAIALASSRTSMTLSGI